MTFGYKGAGGPPTLAGLSLAIARGAYVGVLGPNGAGKSTLLRLLAGTLQPLAGTVLLDGAPVCSFARRALARRIAVLPQRLQLAFDAGVEDLVFLGRTPHAGALAALRGPSARDRAAVEAALAATDTTRFRGRTFQELSGGEQQRVALALALAQEPEALLLDEPTSHLDPGQAPAILDLIAGLQRERGLTVVAVFHDLNLAALYARRLVVIDRGRLVADGPPAAVLEAAALAAVFGPRLRVVPHPEHAVPQVLPVRGQRKSEV